MSDLIVSKRLVQELIDSAEPFPVDFDDAWQWLGYTRKDNALRKLKKYFLAGQDFSLLQVEEAQKQGERTVTAKIDKYFLTVECLKELGMVAQTEQGKLVRKYYLECERIVKTVIPAQNDRIQELELEIQLRNAETQSAQAQKLLLDTRHYITTTLPEPIQQKILGYSEVKTVEYVDRTIAPSGNTYDGVGITYIQKRYGFKSTKAAWDWLESIGCGKLSGHWETQLAAVERQSLPRELLGKLDSMAQQGNRQPFLGE